MSSILIITRDFSPYCRPTGWMVRTVSLSNFLVENGYDITVLASRRSRSMNELRVDPRVKRLWVKNRVQYYKSHHNSLYKVLLIFPLLMWGWKKLTGGFIYDDDLVAVPQYRNHLAKLFKAHSYDHIVISTPPHSLQLLVPWIREELPDVNIISDFRDAWSFRSMYQGSDKQLAAVQKCEKDILKQVDHAVFTSDGMAEIYDEHYDIKNTVVVENGYTDVPTGTPDSEFTRSMEELKNAGYITFGYFGSGSVGIPDGHKDLTRLFDAIESEEKLLEKFAIIVQGKINGYGSFDSPVKHLIFPPTDLTQVYSHIKMVDFGLTVFTDPPYYAPAVVTAKTYEYIYCNKPIIGLADKNASSLRKIMKETGGYFANINDQYEVVALLFRVLEDVENGSAFKNSKLTENREKFSRVYQYKKYLDLLQSK